MMKKLLVLMLILGVGSFANGALAGLVLTGPSEVLEGADFQLTVSGLASAATGLGIAGGVYSTPGAGGQSAKECVVLQAAGNLGSALAYDDGFFNGWDFAVGALLPQTDAEQVKDGDWVVLTFVGGLAGTSETFMLYNYNVSYDDAVASWTVNYIPEPMSMLLLGLGGLFLRRRK